ncbi:aldo/keto reductase [Microbacterium oleivorans]|uniref:Aldo/keto reductase n=1 Tax=Microbacterium oleivorans TaxID=273677 RepID=A0A177K6R5_9MICO|nr:aldo/keto reductase [Microbacterium oleivorans]OAH49080.1 aldo/keto reductase [Microbacterium oleivorans]
MSQRTLGPFTVSAIGLGAMPVSMNGNGIPSHEDAVTTVRAALDAGVTLIDTADIYAPSWDEMGHNERIVADALAGWDGDRSSIVVATKGGITRTAEKDFGRDGSLDYLRSAVQKSLQNLKVDVIDLYQYHRPDRWMVYGEIMQNLKTLQDEGLVRTVGISNASVEEIQIAQEVLGEGGLTSVQNEFSPRHPGSYGELTYCVEHGIPFLPWSPLGGIGGAGTVGERFTAFAEIGREHGVSPQQVVLAWELSLGETVIPIPGASRPASITDSFQARNLELSADELARCSAAVGIDV